MWGDLISGGAYNRMLFMFTEGLISGGGGGAYKR